MVFPIHALGLDICRKKIDNVKIPQNWGQKYYFRTDYGSKFFVIVSRVGRFSWAFLGIYIFEYMMYPGSKLPGLSLLFISSSKLTLRP